MTDEPVQLIASPGHAERLAFAEAWLTERGATGAVRVVAPTQRAADDLARSAARGAPGLLGIERTTPNRLATQWATPALAESGRARLSAFAAQALAVRAVHRVTAHAPLAYFDPVQHFSGFARAAARTLLELRLAEIPPAELAADGGPRGQDLARLLAAFDEELSRLGLADAAAVLEAAIAATPAPVPATVFVDLRPTHPLERRWLQAIAQHGGDILVLGSSLDPDDLPHDKPTVLAESNVGRLALARRQIFATSGLSSLDDDGQVTLFSAPGEPRECVEIARRVVSEAAAGRPFDDMAVLLARPEVYGSLVEDALRRAGVPMFCTAAAQRPRPAGRALLALLACAVENLSARRFAEYLSLGQVPALDPSGALPEAAVPWVAPKEDGQLSFASPPASDDPDLPPETDDSPSVAGHLQAPHQWERLLVDAEVRAGAAERWRRRLEGYQAELRLQLRRLSDGQDSTRARLQSDLRSLTYLTRFAVDIVSGLEQLPGQARWAVWLDHLKALAVRGLRSPEPVLAVLGELSAMAEVGPVSLDEVRLVLHDRLAFLQEEPAGHRFGKVFVAPIDEAAGRAFGVVFVPGLAQGLFPRPIYEDPLLPDADRARLDEALPLVPRRRQEERRRFRLALGAATERLVASYPRIDTIQSRARVPSFYAFDLMRAVDGRLPAIRDFERGARSGADAEWGWPAPTTPETAVDASEYDLAVLGPHLLAPNDTVRGRGRYLMDDGNGRPANAYLVRALAAEARRWRAPWTYADGLVCSEPATLAALAAHHPTARAYSATALQNFADCPLKFALQAIHRLRPQDPVAPVEELDPLTRGALFHEVQFHFLQRLRAEGRPVQADTRDEVRGWLDAAHTQVAETFRDRLAPPVPAVWNKAMEQMRIDLHGWLRRMIEGGGWRPLHAELAFGLPGRTPGEHDDASVDESAVVLGKYPLRGAIDLVEAHPAVEQLRITDHKTGKAIDKSLVHIGGGRHLQPVLYALAAEQLTGRPVERGRLFYCTRRGGYEVREVVVDDDARAAAQDMFTTLENAFARGFFPAAPRSGACRWCDYQRVCGPFEELRVASKQQDALSELVQLRGRA